jgi:DNA-binding NtrC family response regulator
MSRILIADDHETLRRAIVRALSDAHHDVVEAANGNLAIERLHQSQFDVVVSDLKMSGSVGMDVLRTAKSLQPNAAVILMTAFGSIATAVEAMRIGAVDFVQKPFEIEEIELRIARAIERRHMKAEVEYLRHTQQDIYNLDRIVGSNGTLQSVLSVVKKVARSNATALIRGETGTGKELIAGALHHNSQRASRSFVKVNCAALHENLLESELFGHEKGAFTGADKQRVGRFEQADGGTLFLDEIGDMSANTQAKVLRVLQEHEFERLGGTRTLKVDVRLIAATNRDLAQMVANGTFRDDLYYRLNVVSIEMPPLRDRKDDIPQLAECFLRRFAGDVKKRMDGIDAAAQALLMRYNWPGNIRELENAIERAVLMADGSRLTSADLRLGELPTNRSPNDTGTVVKIPPAGIALQDIERHAIIKALEMSNGVQKDAAKLLSISPRVMSYKLKMLGIDNGRGERRSVLAAVA